MDKANLKGSSRRQRITKDEKAENEYGHDHNDDNKEKKVAEIDWKRLHGRTRTQAHVRVRCTVLAERALEITHRYVKQRLEQL